jgi:hypothetical protein
MLRPIAGRTSELAQLVEAFEMEPSQEELPDISHCKARRVRGRGLSPLFVEKAFEITGEYEETAQQGQRSDRQLLRRIRVANEESKTSSGCRAAPEQQLWRSKHIFFLGREMLHRR